MMGLTRLIRSILRNSKRSREPASDAPRGPRPSGWVKSSCTWSCDANPRTQAHAVHPSSTTSSTQQDFTTQAETQTPTDMKITKTSVYTGITRTRELPITTEEIRRWQSGELIQNVWPDLSDTQRLFLIDGATQQEWDALWPDPTPAADDVAGS